MIDAQHSNNSLHPPSPQLFPPVRRDYLCARSAGERSTGPFSVSASPPALAGEGDNSLASPAGTGLGRGEGCQPIR